MNMIESFKDGSNDIPLNDSDIESDLKVFYVVQHEFGHA